MRVVLVVRKIVGLSNYLKTYPTTIALKTGLYLNLEWLGYVWLLACEDEMTI